MKFYTRKEMIGLLGIKEVTKLDKYAKESMLPKTLVYYITMEIIHKQIKKTNVSEEE